MKKFSQRHAFEFPAGQVIAAVTSEDYLRFRYEDSRLLGFKLDVERDDEDEFACRIERVVAPGDNMPKVARRLVGERITIVQHTQWLRQGPPYAGTLQVTIPGMPGSINSNLQLQAQGGQACQVDNAGSIEVKIPLAGGQIERLLAGVAEETFTESMKSIDEYLSRQG